MSVGPLGFFGSIAAVPAAQLQGSETDRAAHESATQSGQISSELKAELAAGIGAPDGQEHGAAERDADGRRLWEKPLGKKQPAAARSETMPPQATASKDPSGESGSQLDLLG